MKTYRTFIHEMIEKVGQLSEGALEDKQDQHLAAIRKTQKNKSYFDANASHVASEGHHHVYVLPSNNGAHYWHVHGKTGKITKLGHHDASATDGRMTDMGQHLHKLGHKISSKMDDKLRTMHDDITTQQRYD